LFKNNIEMDKRDVLHEWYAQPDGSNTYERVMSDNVPGKLVVIKNQEETIWFTYDYLNKHIEQWEKQKETNIYMAPGASICLNEGLKAKILASKMEDTGDNKVWVIDTSANESCYKSKDKI
jgi:hypothetical protein